MRFQLLWQRKFITLSPTKHVINVSISRPFQQIQNPETIPTHLRMHRNNGDVFAAADSNARGIWGRIWNTLLCVENILFQLKMWYKIKPVTLKCLSRDRITPLGKVF